MSDERLRTNVEEELYWDPRVDAEAIAVNAEDGVVVLRGTVGSLRERREATSAAKRVFGVERMENQLQVRLLDEHRRDDADLRGAVLQALMLDSLVPSGIEAKVRDGIVTLSGIATYQFERDEADFVAGNVAGVVWVTDDIELTVPPAEADDVKHDIKKAMQRDAKLDATGISVETYHGTVTLSGSVRSWAEHDAAVDAAWAAPGVSTVEDDLLVSY
jgi:osmotically-inducible protein OsmY